MIHAVSMRPIAFQRTRKLPTALSLLFGLLMGCAHDSVPQPSPISNSAQMTQGIKRIYQSGWAGGVLFGEGARPLRVPPHRFKTIEAEWIVPHAKPTINCSDPNESVDGSSIWIGIDGWMATFKAHERGRNGKWHTYDSTDVLQAGTESDVRCYRGGSLKNYRTSAYFWVEWAGTTDIRVTRRHRDLPIQPGDRVDVRISAASTGPDAWREATLWFVDETTKKAVPPITFHSGCVDCGNPYQRPATLLGDTAEWVAETTFYSSIRSSWPNTLDDFGKVELTKAVVTDVNGVRYSAAHPRGATANIDWMTWNGESLSNNGTLLACAYVHSPASVVLVRAPYAIATPGQQGDLEPKPKNCLEAKPVHHTWDPPVVKQSPQLLDHARHSLSPRSRLGWRWPVQSRTPYGITSTLTAVEAIFSV